MKTYVEQLRNEIMAELALMDDPTLLQEIYAQVKGIERLSGF